MRHILRNSNVADVKIAKETPQTSNDLKGQSRNSSDQKVSIDVKRPFMRTECNKL